MLFQSSACTSTLSVCPTRPENTYVGNICFCGLKPNNYKIRSLFLREIISTPYVIFYWNSFFSNVNWTQVWSLPQKFLLTNKVKEISYKLIHRVYPTKVFLQKFKINIDLKCSFCECSTETTSHLFWSCHYTQLFWNNVEIFIANNILKTFKLSYKYVIVGYYIEDHSGCRFYYTFYFYVNFTFINASLQIADLFLWYLKKRSKCM